MLRTIKTIEDLDNFSQQLDAVEGSLYKTRVKAPVPESIKQNFEIEVGIDAKKKFLDKVRDELAHARVLEMKIPVNIQEDIVDKITDFLKINVGEDVVLDLKVDPTVLAGAELFFEGRYKDCSLKDAITKEIDNYVFI